jgi:YhcN/YlaJ family sporulation lipoprotein
MKKINTIFILSLIFFLFGCAANNDEDQALNNRDQNEIQNVRYDNDNRDITDDRNNKNNLNINNRNQRLEVADEAAERISKLEEVETSNVIVTNRIAYVAVELRDGAKGEVTNKLEEKIADQVRATDSDIQNVYVSTNPDFVKRMTDYTDRINQGDPIEGFFEEFNEMVRRVFPNPR